MYHEVQDVVAIDLDPVPVVLYSESVPGRGRRSGSVTHMFVDASYHEALVMRLHLVRHHSSHKMDCGLHALVLDLLVFVDEMAR